MHEEGHCPVPDRNKASDKGMNILGAHIDSPRLDVKQNPLYEDNGFTYLIPIITVVSKNGSG